MSRVKLLPRLSPASAQLLLEELDVKDGIVLPPDEEYIERGFALAAYAATGGTKDDDSARVLAADLRKIAQKHGHMGNKQHKQSHALFDSEAARYLAENPVLHSGEALCGDVWTFLSVVLLPDVIAWRFPNLPPSRFHGGIRNAFQRLWVRGINLDRGEQHPDRWGLISALTEDAMVQIFERASILASPGLSRVIAEVWLERATKPQRRSLEELSRIALKMLRIRNEIIDLSMLSEEEMKEEVRLMFDRALQQYKSAASASSSFEPA